MKRGFALGALLAVVAVVAVVVMATVGAAPRRSAQAAVTPALPPRPLAGTLDGVGFSASLLGGWKLTTVRSPGGAVTSDLSSTGAPVEAFAVPPAGTIALSIAERPSSAAANSETPLSTIAKTVVPHPGAGHIQLAAPPRPAQVAGSSAAEEALTYTWHGVHNVQVDVLARHGGRTFLVELDGEPGLGPESSSALQLLFSSWRWR